MSTVYSLGVMTGTSCDGADFALLELRRSGGAWSERLVRAASRPFPAALRRRLRDAQSGRISLAEGAHLTRDYSGWLGANCAARLRAWKTPLSRTLIAAHGQTVWHEPQSAVSVQLLDPAVLSCATDCTVTAAFRQPDLARGGQGAPLVPYYHWLRARSGPFARALPFAVHNVGGIANLTYVTRDIGDLVAFDTGPGNALIDLAVEAATRGKQRFDRNGRIAAGALGHVQRSAIERLARHPYFRARPPKSTGRELFNEDFLRRLPGRGAALVANATAFTAHTMAKAYADFVPAHLSGVFVAGGGARNRVLMALFVQELVRLRRDDIPVAMLPDTFAPPQHLEAMAFARLGFEALRGRPVSLASVTGASRDAIGAGIYPASNYPRLLKLLDIF